ncbi:MAG TPA: hypothetical protein VNB06_08280, partial [Thermoanaerobaculia bacterium]|nr:hypothetical protein [Thermoanaerobaculia bacterium]
MPERLPASLPPAFVTYGWCRVSYAIVHSLARRGVEVHVGDIAPDAMCRYSRKVARFWRHRSPVEDPDGFLDDLVAALDGSGARVLLPGHEDALFLAANRERLPEGVELPVADAQIVDRLRNKWEAL